MNKEKLVSQFIADAEKIYDEEFSILTESVIYIHQLIEKEDGSFEGFRYPINNPSEQWYPKRFAVIDEVLDYYEALTDEHNDTVVCTIFAEAIVTYESYPIVNLFIKHENGRIAKILDYRDVMFSVNESGELVSTGGKSYVCNRADYNLNNNKK